MPKAGRVFLCHNSLEKELIKPLALELLSSGAVRTWLDTWEIPGGKDWEKHIRREFAASWSCVVFVGAAGFGPFQKIEVGWANERQAIDPDYRVIPVLLPGVEEQALLELSALLPKVHWIDLRKGGDFAESLTPIFRALRGDGPGPPVQALAVAVAAERWAQTDKTDGSILIRGKALREAQQLLRRPDAYDELSLAFLAASAAAAQRRIRWGVALLASVAIALAGLAGFAYYKQIEAQAAEGEALLAQEREKKARQIAETARANEVDARKQAEKDRDYALVQEGIAKEQRDIAQERMLLARSQAVAADARREAPQELNAALVGSAAAYRTNPSIEAQTALFESLTRAQKIQNFFLCPHGQKATGVAFSPGQDPLIAFACGSAQKTAISVVDPRDQASFSLTVEGDGRALTFVDRNALAIGGARDIRILNVADRSVHTYSGHGNAISSVAAAPERGWIFTSDALGEVRVWQRSTGARELWSSEVLRGKTSRAVRHMLWVFGGDLQAEEYGIGDIPLETIHLGTGHDGPRVTRPPTPGTYTFSSLCEKDHPASTRYSTIVRSDDSLALAYTTEANEIVVEHPRSQSCEGPMFGHTHNILGIAIRPGGMEIASAGAIADADETHGVIVWDLNQVHPLARVLIPAQGPVPRMDVALALSQDGLSWACANCGEQVTWDGTSVPLPDHIAARSITSVALSADGRELAIGSGDGEVVRAKRAGAEFHFDPMRPTSSSIRSLWYAAHVLYSIGADGAVARWIKGASENIDSVPRPDNAARCTDLYQTGPDLAFEVNDGSAEQRITVRSLLTRESRTVSVPNDAGSCASLAYASERKIAIRLPTSYEPMYILSPSTGAKRWDNPIRAMPSGLRTILSMARVAGDGSRLTAVSNGNSLVIFDVPSQRLIGTVDVPEMRAVTMSTNGHRVLTYGASGLLMWTLDSENWVKKAETMAGRIASPPKAGIHVN